MLGVITTTGVVLGLASMGNSCGKGMSVFICILGPLLLYSWFSYGMILGWMRLLAYSCYLAFIGLTIEYKYYERITAGVSFMHAFLPITQPNIYSANMAEWQEYFIRIKARLDVSLIVVRVFVPIFGLGALIVVGHYLYSVVRAWCAGPTTYDNPPDEESNPAKRE